MKSWPPPPKKRVITFAEERVVKFSLFCFSAIVLLSDKNRVMGSGAKTLMMSNLKNTVMGFKKFIGRNYNDPQVQAEKSRVLYEVVEGPDGTTGIQVRPLAFSINRLNMGILHHIQ